MCDEPPKEIPPDAIECDESECANQAIIQWDLETSKDSCVCELDDDHNDDDDDESSDTGTIEQIK